MKACLDFASKLESDPVRMWENVILSDEIKINFLGQNLKQYMWHKLNTDHAVKYGGGRIMLWSSTIDEAKYKKMLLDILLLLLN